VAALRGMCKADMTLCKKLSPKFCEWAAPSPACRPEGSLLDGGAGGQALGSVTAAGRQAGTQAGTQVAPWLAAGAVNIKYKESCLKTFATQVLG